MNRHVYIVASGFGLRVVPKSAPYRFALDHGHLRIDVTLAAGQRSAWVESSQPPGETEVADIIEGPAWQEWWLETSPYRVPLPEGWTADVSGSLTPVPFDLVSASGALIYIQTPRSSHQVRDLIAPGQNMERTWSDTDGEWLDVSYVHDGSTWYQRHCLRRWSNLVAVITAQAERHALDEAFSCHARVANMLAPQQD